MKICFSTLGCPNWKWNEIVSAAKDLGYHGIELRGLGEDLFLPDVKFFREENIENTKKELNEASVMISCLSSDCRLNTLDADIEQVVKEIETARRIGAPNLRILGDTWGNPGDPVDDDLVYSRIQELVPYARAAGVTMLLESNGAFAESARLKKMIERVDSPALKALWDINHPVRYFNESVETTWSNIGQYVRHVHLKDSAVENGALKYKMLGYGDLPLREALSVLKANGYNGFLSLEWTKRWNSELEDAGIVFAHFAYMVNKIWAEA